ncbi:hypothetical protein PQ689_05935 [Thermoanaerobacterium thermosaccharolyticum]|nr:hypothetical protein Q2T46_14930 [Thermoanaerobacterium sp. CMT5567-10]
MSGYLNDCAKAHVNDIGIIGITKTEYDYGDI